MWKYEFFDINGWLHQYQMFSEFHVNLIERFYGRIYTTTNLPWWYAFSWMPFLMHPIGFVLSCIGIVFFIFDHSLVDFRVLVFLYDFYYVHEYLLMLAYLLP